MKFRKGKTIGTERSVVPSVGGGGGREDMDNKGAQ